MSRLPRISTRSVRIGAAVLLAAGATAAATMLRADRELEPAAPETTRAVSVRTFALPDENTSERAPLASTGTLEPGREVWIGFPVSGVVATLFVDEGDVVRPGQSLAALDPVPFRAATEQAEARAAFLRERIERSRVLASRGAVSGEELDADENELVAAEAQLRATRWSQERSVLRAPFRGRIRAEQVELGQVVAAGAPAFELIATDTLELEVSVAARDLRALDLDGTIAVRPADGLEAPARLAHAPVSADPRSGSVPLRLLVPNVDGRLLPGTIAEAILPTIALREEPLVPLSALRVDPDGPSVFVLERDRARRRSVETGAVRGTRIEVTRGLEPGARLVLEPPDRLRDGDLVRVVED